MDVATAYFVDKIEPSSQDLQSQTNSALMVYGVDFLDTQQIGNMFTIPGQDPRKFIRKIHWKDESNCLVDFFAPEGAEIAIKSLSLK